MFRDTIDIAARRIAIVGNPNSGKTTLFNVLTGLRQKVANYPGVTVEKKEGRIILDDRQEVTLLDLPGSYSLTPHSPDEKIATDVLLGRLGHTPAPDGVICVVDASNLERNLYLVSQIIDCEVPMVIALTMVDAAEKENIVVDAGKLSARLGIKVIPTVATKGIGIRELKRVLGEGFPSSPIPRQWTLPEPMRSELTELTGIVLHHHRLTGPEAFQESLHLLSSPAVSEEQTRRFAPDVLTHVRQDHQRLDALGIDRFSTVVEARYDWIQRVCRDVVTKQPRTGVSISDRIDRISRTGSGGS